MTSTIAFVLKGYPRLSETFIAQEILGLERAGFVLRIVALRRPTDSRTHPIHGEIQASVAYLPEYLREEPLRVLRGLIACRRKPGFKAAFRTWLRDLGRDPTPNRVRRFGQALVLAAELPADVGHLHAHFIHTPASVTRYASLLTGLDWSCSAHAKDIWTSTDWDLEGKLASAEFTVTCTGAGRDHLNRLAPPDRLVELVYHGLDLTRFSRVLRDRARRDGSDAASPIELLSVGRAVSKKGFDVLLAALAQLPRDLHWRWTHIGNGDELAALKRLAAETELDGRITWLGAQEQSSVLHHYRRADIFVLPCRIAGNGDRDGLPNVLMEAQSQGLCCISTTVSGIPELIVHNVTGLLVPPEDSAALAAALERLMTIPDLRKSLGEAGANHVRDAFDHGRGIARLASLFAERGVERAPVRKTA